MKCVCEFNIVFEDVFIIYMMFGKEFIKVVEQKQIVQQDVERVCFIVEWVEQECQVNVICVEGEVESVEVISKVIVKVGDGFI